MLGPIQDVVLVNKPIVYLPDVIAAVSEVAKSILGFLPDPKQVESTLQVHCLVLKQRPMTVLSAKVVMDLALQASYMYDCQIRGNWSTRYPF